jgi:hypothetical protein
VQALLCRLWYVRRSLQAQATAVYYFLSWTMTVFQNLDIKQVHNDEIVLRLIVHDAQKAEVLAKQNFRKRLVMLLLSVIA